jgi:hypothetical protein
MTRASAVLPFKPYVYRGAPRPVVLPPSLAAERSGSDCTGPGTGWDPLARDERDEVAGQPAPVPVRRCGSCGYLLTAPGHLIECAPVTARKAGQR